MNKPTHSQTTNLGSTDIQISPLGIGTWSWGDRFFWGYGTNYGQNDLQETFDFILDSGINFFDTAEVYGMGRSERLLGQFAKSRTENIVVATKWFPFPWRVDPFSHTRSLRNSLRRLQMEQVALYQLHWAIPPYPVEFWMKRLYKTYQAGLTKAIGVSNFNLAQTQLARNFLLARGTTLASNQARYNILNREIEKNGLLDFCQTNKITLIAYSPLAMGMLTGKYTPDNPVSGVRRHSYKYTPDFLEKIQPLIATMREIGAGHGSKTPAQVALNWVISKGAIPIPGAKNIRQAEDNIAALDWRLAPDEIAVLDRMSDQIQFSG